VSRAPRADRAPGTCLPRVIVALVAVAASGPAANAHHAGHDGGAQVTYLANEGILVSQGETKILFDPLFDESFGEYRLVPEPMLAALHAGEPPWDGVDVIFVSHHHADHFSPQGVLEFLRVHGDVHLYAPAQAVAALRTAAGDAYDALADRLHGVVPERGGSPQRMAMPGLLVEAISIPHAGWPDRAADVEHIAWRVTLNERTTVLHLGDADAKEEHFAARQADWDERVLHAAFPPFWFLLSEQGRRVLDERLRPLEVIGVHVPVTVPPDPAEREGALAGVELFTEPGETREIPALQER